METVETPKIAMLPESYLALGALPNGRHARLRERSRVPWESTHKVRQVLRDYCRVVPVSVLASFQSAHADEGKGYRDRHFLYRCETPQGLRGRPAHALVKESHLALRATARGALGAYEFYGR